MEQQVFHTLDDRLLAQPGLQVRLIVDISPPFGDTSTAPEPVNRFFDRFRNQQRPADRLLPLLCFDSRSMEPRTEHDKRKSRYAQGVIIDHRHVFLTSATFTEPAQQRNIEVGLLFDSPPVARRLEIFYETLFGGRDGEACGVSIGGRSGPELPAVQDAPLPLYCRVCT